MRPVWVSVLLLCAATAVADPLDDYLFSQDRALRDRWQMPAPPKARWIDAAELRLTPEQNTAGIRNETYSFRFRPTSGRERDALRDLFGVENELASIEWGQARSEAIARRYGDLIELAEQEVRAAVVQRQLLLDQSEFATRSAMSASSGFSSADLQDSALRVERRRQQLQHLMRKTSLLRAATVDDLLAVENTDEPDVSPHLIPPEEVGAMLDRIASGSNAHISARAQAELRLAQSEVALEESRARFGINLLELSYEDRTLDSHAITLGFRIPLGRDNFGVQRRLRDANVARQQAYLVDLLVEDEVQSAIRDMRWKIDAYQLDRAAVRALQDRIATRTTDVASLVSLRQHQLDLMDAAAMTHLELLRDYVSFLHFLGALEQQRNWIRSS